MATQLHSILAVMTAQTRRVLVPQLEKPFKDTVIDVAILKSSQKLGYEALLKIKHRLSAVLYWEAMFCDATKEEWQVVLSCFSSYILTVCGCLLQRGIFTTALLLLWLKGLGWLLLWWCMMSTST